MIKTTGILKKELEEYANPAAKIRRMVDDGALTPIIRGLYETDRSTPGHYLASIIYGPSYLSFEYALSFYSLIPEAVYHFTSATFEKKKRKLYKTPFGIYTYRDVPSKAFPLDVILHTDENYGFQIASPEKALCDQLYTLPPLANKEELVRLIFDDLRIDEADFANLNMDTMSLIASHYKTKSHELLKSYIR